jgi:signal transduction histidine kinase
MLPMQAGAVGPHPVTASTGAELDAAILQAVVTLGLAALFAFLHRRTHRVHFAWFAGAWALYLLRLAAIGTFLLTGRWSLLYWHQVVTGWTALALLWAALTFARGLRWRPVYLAFGLFPPVWSYLAIYRLDNFLLAATPAVAFLSLVTMGTGWVFMVHARRTRSLDAWVLAAAFVLWGVHHLDYPFLRARGAWVPWGYYLDIVFTLVVGAGTLLLVLGERSAELERLQRRMVQQHEEERRRLSLHLHDETAQLFTAVKLQLGVLREQADAALATPLDQVLGLMDEGILSIRNLTNDLRPSLLDDLGLLPALRSLAGESAARYRLPISVEVPDRVPPLSPDAEVALFRALQEALANVAEHAGATRASVRLCVLGDAVMLEVRDDGKGLPAAGSIEGLERSGHLGLAGMRERVTALGGTLTVGAAPDGGAQLVATVPVEEAVV